MAKPNFKLSKRMVSARFWTNPELSRLAKQSKIPNLKLTMIGLWAFSDEAGIFEWQPDIAAGMIYGLDTDAERETVEPAMNAMVEAGFLKKIEVNGHWYGAWPHWGEHNDFRNNSSRYPEVADALGYPRKGGSTLNSPQRPSEVEGEVEGEALPPIQTNRQGTPSGGQEKDQTPPASSGDGGPAERLARLLFRLLDQPRDQIKNAGLWETQVAALLKTHPEEEIASVMEYGVKADKFSAEYLTLAKQPMASFVKTYDNIYKGWKALQKGAAAAANRADKLAKKVSAPGAHGNQSGMEL
jgi:hypothetical protein